MKKFVTLFIIAFCSVSITQAQTFTDHIQQKQNGLGTVTISQSEAIEELVNGNNHTNSNNTKTATAPTAQKNTAKSATKNEVQKTSGNHLTHNNATTLQTEEKARELAAERKAEAEAEAEAAKRREAEAAKRREEANKAAKNAEEDEMSIPTVDMRKKVMRGSHKVTGYRVQAFAGGNSRADKIKAQKIGNAIKMKYPDVPVYVHFYSPRWICRVGNFRSYEQAHNMLKKVRAMGYRSATIVRGKITVQY